MTNQTNEDLLRSMTDPVFRVSLVKQSFEMFVRIYFVHHITDEFAPFHYRMFDIAEDAKARRIAISAFRGSGKSTIFTLAYPIWAMMSGQSNFILLISQTLPQAKQHLANIRHEFEQNELLKTDIGPFISEGSEWNTDALVVSDYNARIVALSRDTSFRGVKFHEMRPDLIVCDDIEDVKSAKVRENREATRQWMSSEVIPCADPLKYRLVNLGNIVHEECFIIHEINAIMSGTLKGRALMVPILDNQGQSAWPTRYPVAVIDEIRASIPDPASWEREYLLKASSISTRLLAREQIGFYTELPKEAPRRRILGVDLAISEKDSADFTALVPIYIYGYGEKMKIYVLPQIVNARMNFPDSVERIRQAVDSMGPRTQVEVAIEDVAYQRSMAQHLKSKGLRTIEKSVAGRDKRGRLAVAAGLVQSKQILFPESGAELLISQLVYFESQNHDDVADAFSLGCNVELDELKQECNPGIGYYDENGRFIWIRVNDEIFQKREAYVKHFMETHDGRRPLGY